ncbi:hypothetical protein Scel_87770 [Streptomyces cellostaticus]|nr:hypothetical protein Scel_87770 [Streptomyces cellostaticus]
MQGVEAGADGLQHGGGHAPAIPWPGVSTKHTACPFTTSPHAVGSLAEACTVIRRLWTEAEPFDFHATYHHLTGAFGNPKPVQRPHPPILMGGRSSATLRVAAEHADLWNIPGGDIDDAIRRSALLDRYGAEIGRDPAPVTRSIHLPVSYDRPGATRDAIGDAIDAGFRHIVLGLPAPYPRWRRTVGHRRTHQHVGLSTLALCMLPSPNGRFTWVYVRAEPGRLLQSSRDY